MPKSRPFAPRTRLVHAGTRRSDMQETSEAIFPTQGFVYPDAAEAERRFANNDRYVYSRYANPTVDMFTERLAAYEGAPAGRATASGMAAVCAATLCHLSAGDHLVAGRTLFGSCRYVVDDLLPRLGIATTLVDGTDPDAWQAALRSETRMFFLETPGNPTLDIADIAAVASIAHEADALLVVDNALASPVAQRPLDVGADVVVYSATKHLDGHGRCLGGAILGSEEFVAGPLTEYLRHTGPTMSPFNAWVFLKSMETLELRCLAQAATAAKAADLLAGHDAIARVLYPGRSDHPGHAVAARQMRNGGSVLAVDFKGGKAAAFRFLEALQLVLISNNFGDAKSLATHPATTTHSRLSPELRTELGIGDGLVRISCGIEDSEDLLEDLQAAADAARKAQ